MNSISWLLYLADVSQRVGVVTGILCGCAGCGVVFSIIGLLATDGEAPLGGVIKYGVIIFIVSSVVGVFAPSKNTVYAIAASELGQRVVTSEVGTDLSKEALATLKDWLRKQRSDDSHKDK